MRVVGFFCEDIRHEIGGSNSIVGILPDNVEVPNVPVLIPKLAVYVRINFDLDEPPRPVVGRVVTPWGEPFLIGEAKEDLVRQSQEQAKERGIPFGGIILRALLSPVTIQTLGMITATVTVGDTEHVCAVLNILTGSSSRAIG